MRKAKLPLIELTVDQCRLYLEAHICPDSGRFVCLGNLAENMASEASKWGFRLSKKSLRDPLAQAARDLGYTVEGIDILNCTIKEPNA